MKLVCLCTIMLALALRHSAGAQDQVIDSLQQQLEKSPDERARIDLINKLSFAYLSYSHDKSRELAESAILQSFSIQYEKGLADGYNYLGVSYALEGKLDSAISNFLKTLRLREKLNDKVGVAKVLNNLAGPYIIQQDYNKAISYSRQSLYHLQGTKDWSAIGNAYLSLGLIYQTKNDYDSALMLFQTAHENFLKGHLKTKLAEVSIYLASIHEKKNELHIALATCLAIQQEIDSNNLHIIDLYTTMARIYLGLNQRSLAFDYFRKAYSRAQALKGLEAQLDALTQLSEAFEKVGQFDSALYYHKKLASLRYENYTQEKVKQVAVLEKLYETEKKDYQLAISEQKLKTQKRFLIAGGLLLGFSFIFVLVILYFHKKSKQLNAQLLAMNHSVHEKNEEITSQARMLEEINREMERINSNLEAEVNQRSQKIIDQNKKLVEYAYFNAHHLRGPLARVLGLINLLHLQELTADQKDILEKMDVSTNQLDVVVKEINQRLDEELTAD